jgi:hypothetical protein
MRITKAADEQPAAEAPPTSVREYRVLWCNCIFLSVGRDGMRSQTKQSPESIETAGERERAR